MKWTLRHFVFVCSAMTSLFVAASAMASLETDVSAIGPHFPIFKVEKNENPENILVAYTKLGDDCQVENNSDDHSKPLFDFYWKMNRETYKPVHSLIKSGIRNRLALVSTAARNRFSVKINDLNELNHGTTKPLLRVVSSRAQNGCDVRSYIDVGDAKKPREIQLSSIYIKSTKTLLPPFRKVVAVTLTGTDVKTKRAVSQVFEAR